MCLLASGSGAKRSIETPPLSFSVRFFTDRCWPNTPTRTWNCGVWLVFPLPPSTSCLLWCVTFDIIDSGACVCVRVALSVCCVPHTHLSRCVAFRWEARNVCCSPPPSFGLFVCVRARSCVSLLPISPLVWCFLPPSFFLCLIEPPFDCRPG